MKIIKIIPIIAVLTVIFLATGITEAQNKNKANKTPEEYAEKVSGKLKERLSLSDYQYKQVYDLFLNHFNERKVNKEEHKNLSKEQKDQLRKQRKEELNKNLENILTSEQLTKYNEIKAEKKKSQKQRKN